MLEAPFKALIEHILKVENSHLEDTSEEAMLSRNWEFVFRDFEGWTILGISTNRHRGIWLYPRLCPTTKVEDLKQTLPDFNFTTPSAAYGEVMQGDNHWIEPYWGDADKFTNAEVPIYFPRHYYGRPKGKENYLEFNQLVTHSLGLEWSETKQSYCILNDLGEEDEKIKIVTADGVRVVLIRRYYLDKLLYLGNWALIRYAEITRWRSDEPNFESNDITLFSPPEYEAKFEIRKCPRDHKLAYVAIRGAAVSRPITPKDKVLTWDFVEEGEEKKYGLFIVQDWKNNKLLKDYSLDPSNFSNYFVKSDLPFETSPIFFKAEVLDKYKNNPDKYKLTEHSINCRGGWYLKTYDVNKHNQVHTYAVYLGQLPYQEQLYWQQFNEAPKGPISEQSFRSDFEAQWPEHASPLEELKTSLEKLGELKFEGEPIWAPKGGNWETAAKGLYYVHTENPNQWHDFIIALANATNEGFQKKALKLIALTLGDIDEELGPLGLIKLILIKTGNESQLPATHAVLNDLQKRRSQGKAHGEWSTPTGSLVEDAEMRLSTVTSAITNLHNIFSNL